MPAPSSPVYSTALNVSAQGLTKTALEAGAGAALLKIYSEADVLLVTITLDDPVGTVSAGGQLPVTAPSAATAVATATATWGDFTDSDGTSVMKAPTAQSLTAIPNVIALNATAIVTGASVELISATFG